VGIINVYLRNASLTHLPREYAEAQGARNLIRVQAQRLKVDEGHGREHYDLIMKLKSTVIQSLRMLSSPCLLWPVLVLAGSLKWYKNESLFGTHGHGARTVYPSSEILWWLI
jgi:hypothetical protein